MAKLYATTIMWFISCPFKLFNLISDQRQSLFLYGEFHNKSMMVLEIPFGHVVFTMQVKYFIRKEKSVTLLGTAKRHRGPPRPQYTQQGNGE